MRTIKILLTLTLFFATSLAADDYDDAIAALKTTAGFSSWPGKGGALKKGLNFQLATYPQLAGYTAVADDTNPVDLDFGILRTLTATSGEIQLKVQIGVAFGSTDNAQELLIRSLAASEMDFSSAWQRGDPGLTLGDFNFVAAGGSAANEWGGAIAFVRNNVVVILTNINPTHPATGLGALATALDLAVYTKPDLTPVQFDALRPAVLQFAPAASSIVAGTSTALNISITDPSGDSFVEEVTSDGSVDIVTQGAQTIVNATNVTGPIPINLLVVDASLLFTATQTSLTVTP
jgi:hypothetical protein